MPWIITLIVAGLWSWPVTPVRITERFDMPEHGWSAGHRGIDLELPPGSIIRSIGDGHVAFVGTVAGTPVIAIEHPGTGLRSTYQPVIPTVRIGDTVTSGGAIGYLARPLDQQEEGMRVGAGGHCDGHCLHLGLRGRDGYIDPLSILPRLSAILKPSLGRWQLRSWVGLRKRGPQALYRHMGVALRRVQRCVPEQFLDSPKVGPSLKDMGGGGMSKPMRSKSRPAGITGDPVDDGPHRTLVDASAPAPHVQRLTRSREPTTHLEPRTSCVGRRHPERHHPLLVPLADYSHGSGLKIKIP